MATNKYVIIYVKHTPMGLLICKIFNFQGATFNFREILANFHEYTLNMPSFHVTEATDGYFWN